MKIKKLMFFAICVVLVCVFIVGCGSASYDVVEEGGAMYLDLHNVRSSSTGDVATGLPFESVAELQERVLFNKLSEEELCHISTYFSKSKNGKIAVLNMNSLQEPVLPQGLTIKNNVEWRGQYIDISLDADETYSDSFYGHYVYCTKTVYDNFRKTALDIQDHFVYSVENIEDRNAKVTVFSTGTTTLKDVEYTIKYSDTTLNIVERYRLQTTSDLECSDTIPYRVYVFGVTGEHYYYYSFNYLGIRPSVEWLLSLGVRDVGATE